MKTLEPAPPGMFEFELTDADGEVHAYWVNAHPPMGERSGSGIMYRLAALGAEPVTGAIAAIMGGDGDGIDSTLDAGGLAAAGRGLRDSLLLQSPEGLVRDILWFTWRDGQLFGQSGFAGEQVFNGAYTRNYGEMLQAAWRVVEYNRFFPLLDSLVEIAQEKWDERMKPSQLSSETGSEKTTTTGSGPLSSPTPSQTD